MGRKTVEFERSGWPLKSNQCGYPGVQLCGFYDESGPCRDVPVWRVQERRRNTLSTGYYCALHLPDEDRDTLAALQASIDRRTAQTPTEEEKP